MLLGLDMTRREMVYGLRNFVVLARAALDSLNVQGVQEPRGSARSEVYVRSVPFAAVMDEAYTNEKRLHGWHRRVRHVRIRSRALGNGICQLGRKTRKRNRARQKLAGLPEPRYITSVDAIQL